MGYEVVLIKDTFPDALKGQPVAAAIFSQHNSLLHQNWANLVTDKILVMAPTSLPSAHNKRVIERFKEMSDRRGVHMAPQRLLDANQEELNLNLATHIFLYGNDVTLDAYPDKFKSKTYYANVSSSHLGANIKTSDEISSSPKGFLWFGGGGIGFKGLDLCLEAFAARPHLNLYVVGDPREDGFDTQYHRELKETPNIRYCGGMAPSSERFRQVIDRCSFLLYPSASEGCSSAVATGMTAGLYPVISRETGITLPADAGCILPRCDVPTLAETVERLVAMDDRQRVDETVRIQAYAREVFSREAFIRNFRTLLTQVMHL